MPITPGKTKILVIGPSLKMGGMERAVCNIANAIHDAGFQVVFTAIFDHVIFFKLRPDIKFLAPSGYNIKKMNFWKTIRRLRMIVSAEKPDVILVYNKFYSALTLFSLLWMRKRPPVFISERSSPHYQWSRPIQLFNAFTFRLNPPEGIIAQTRIAARYQREYYPKSAAIEVIPNILREVTRYPEVQREAAILAVGRFNDSLKGFDRLIKAFALIKNDWRLIFAGGRDGEDASLDGLISSLGLGKHIELHGKVSDIDMLYAKASIFVIPSRSEGYPNALCEAMSAGMACISYDFVAGPREIIEHGVNGLLIPEGDIQALADALQLLMTDADLRSKLGKEAMKITDRLGADTIMEKHIEFFNERIIRN
jgi:glycosyltransferase involved in cell wall biosynthesis